MTTSPETGTSRKSAKHKVKRKKSRRAVFAQWIETLNAKFWRTLDQAVEETPGAAAAGTRLVRLIRVLVLSALSFNVNEVPVRASALVFTTLLAFIPMTIILSSIAGWLGYIHLIQELIPNLMASLNLDLRIDFIMNGLARAESVGFHQLGIFGSAGLLIGFFLSMSNVEDAMNRVWNVRSNRGWPGRIVRYTPFLLLLLGLLVVSVFLLFRAHQFLGEFLEDWGFYGGSAVSFPVQIPGGAILFGSLGVVVLMWMLMVLMIWLLPNTRVRFRWALWGATAGIVPLYLVSRLLLIFPSLFIARNQLFYGSLAIVPVALLLVYVFWGCTLFGCTVAFVNERLKHVAGISFFTRGAGFREDWANAVREVEELYRKPSPPIETVPDKIEDALEKHSAKPSAKNTENS